MKQSIVSSGSVHAAQILSFAMLLTFMVAPVARAGYTPLAPGQTVNLDSAAYQSPAGTVIAQNEQTIEIPYQPAGTFVNFSGFATGQFSDLVVQNPTTGDLTFFYSIALADEAFTAASQASDLTVAGFSKFGTSVSGTLQFQQDSPIQRSADGSTLHFYSGEPGMGGPPTLAVATNATKFNDKGTVTYSLADLFRVQSATGQSLTSVWGHITLPGAYQPIGSATGTSGNTPQSVPTPSSFFAGLGVMIGCLLIVFVRKSLGA